MQRDDNQRDWSIKKTLKCKKSKQKIVKTRLVLIYTYIGIKRKTKKRTRWFLPKEFQICTSNALFRQYSPI